MTFDDMFDWYGDWYDKADKAPARSGGSVECAHEWIQMFTSVCCKHCGLDRGVHDLRKNAPTLQKGR